MGTLEAVAVDTADVRGLLFMRTDVHRIERTVILVTLMILTVLHGTVDGIVGDTIVMLHTIHLHQKLSGDLTSILSAAS
jgi:hypothetical protein